MKLEEYRKHIRVASLNNTFANFKKVKGAEESFRLFQNLASGETSWQMLLCYGGVGNGKTYLLEALTIDVNHRGRFVRILTMATIMATLKRAMRKDSLFILEDQVVHFSETPMLLIDDVGMGGSGSDWEWGQLEDIIVYRYRENLFTVLTSNLDIVPNPKNPSQAFIPERIVSRFKDHEKARLVLNEAPDYRPKKEG